MTSALETIDVCSLESVCGGEGQNTTSTSGNVGVTVRRGGADVQVGVQGDHKTSRTNYSVCVDNYRQMGGAPQGLRASCGLPNGQP